MKLHKAAAFIVTHKFFLLLFGILFLTGIFFRFINFQDRWTLSQDQARDAITADFALETGILPLVGPHSSAGEFSFGPIYYWLIIFFKLFSSSIISSWIGFTILSCLSVGIFGLIGYKLSDKKGTLIFTFIAALASSPILHSTDMLNPIPIAFFVSLIFLCLLYFLSTQKKIFIFLLGLFIGIAVNFHFESFLLLPLLFVFPSFIAATRQTKLTLFSNSLIGLFSGLSPLILFDITNQNFPLKNFLTYTFAGQENVSVSISWIKELSSFWPQFFGEILFNMPYLGYPVVLLIITAFVILRLNKTPLPLSVSIISSTFLIQLFLLHFYNGVRSPVYMIVFHPFIILLTAFSFLTFYSLSKYVGFLILILFLMFSVTQNLKIINQKNQLNELKQYQAEITTKSSGKVSLYERPASSLISLPLFYLYNYEKALDDKGYRIGLCESKDLKNDLGEVIGNNCPKDPSPFGGDGHFQLFDLNGFPDEKLQELGFTKITGKGVYNKLYEGY